MSNIIKLSNVLLFTIITFTNLYADPPQQFPPECVDGWLTCINDAPYEINTPEHTAYITGCVNSWMGCIGA